MKKAIIIILAAIVAFSTAVSAAEHNPKKAKAELKEVTFNAHIHCAGCVKKLQENLSFEKGVKGLHICMEDQIIWLKYDAAKTNEDVLQKAIVKLGVEVKGKSQHGHQHGHQHNH